MTRKKGSMAVRRWARKMRRQVSPTACQRAQHREGVKAANWASWRERRP
jgi:hypothetical protein